MFLDPRIQNDVLNASSRVFLLSKNELFKIDFDAAHFEHLLNSKIYYYDVFSVYI